jgi:hypothetical protein
MKKIEKRKEKIGRSKPVFNLKIKFSDKKKLPRNLKTKWREIIKSTDDFLDGPCIVFLAEILEIIDSKAKCKFICSRFTGYDMFSGCDIDWTLTTGKYSINRIIQREISDSWQRVEEEADSIIINGFPKEHELKWNGETGGVLSSVEIIVPQINIDQEKQIIQIGKILWSDGAYSRI